MQNLDEIIIHALPDHSREQQKSNKKEYRTIENLPLHLNIYASKCLNGGGKMYTNFYRCRTANSEKICINQERSVRQADKISMKELQNGGINMT